MDDDLFNASLESLWQKVYALPKEHPARGVYLQYIKDLHIDRKMGYI
jgi:hypothetical protein